MLNASSIQQDLPNLPCSNLCIPKSCVGSGNYSLIHGELVILGDSLSTNGISFHACADEYSAIDSM